MENSDRETEIGIEETTREKERRGESSKPCFGLCDESNRRNFFFTRSFSSLHLCWQ